MKKITLADARKIGAKHYSGRPCRSCGKTVKFVSNQSCVFCTTKRTKERSSDVYRKYIKSQRGQSWLKEYRHSIPWRETQKRFGKKTGFWNEQQSRRRKQIVLDYEKLTADEKQQIKDIYKDAAAMTCKTGVAHHVDHIVPLRSGGKHHPDNLQVLIESEHWLKCATENRLFFKKREENQ